MASAWRRVHRLPDAATVAPLFVCSALTRLPARLAIMLAPWPRAMGVADIDLRGTLALATRGELSIALASLMVGVKGIAWAFLARRIGRASLRRCRDLTGAERAVDGVIQRTMHHGGGPRRGCLMPVSDDTWLVAMHAASALRSNIPLGLRVTRVHHVVGDNAAPAEAPA